MNRNTSLIKRGLVLVLAVLLFSITTAGADEVEDLAKQAQNPVSNLINLPFQNNTNFNVGPGDDVQNVLNIQPVVPFSVNENWNLITRTIVPLIYQPEVIPGYGSEFGLGDINATFFMSPAKPGRVIWGVGPVISFPTASDRVLGAEKWSAGPSAVALTMQGHWVVGALANNLWSFAGDDDRPAVNQFLFQYFINYNLPDGWYVTSAPIITANLKAESGNKWTVPFGGGAGRLIRIGRLPVNLSAQAYYNVESPEQGPDWTLRLQLQMLFPK